LGSRFFGLLRALGGMDGEGSGRGPRYTAYQRYIFPLFKLIRSQRLFIFIYFCLNTYFLQPRHQSHTSVINIPTYLGQCARAEFYLQCDTVNRL